MTSSWSQMIDFGCKLPFNPFGSVHEKSQYMNPVMLKQVLGDDHYSLVAGADLKGKSTKDRASLQK